MKFLFSTIILILVLILSFYFFKSKLVSKKIKIFLVIVNLLYIFKYLFRYIFYNQNLVDFISFLFNIFIIGIFVYVVLNFVLKINKLKK